VEDLLITNKEDNKAEIPEIVKPINSTIHTMKRVLIENKISFPNNISKDELTNIVRKNYLVRECENSEKIRKIKKPV